MDKLIYDRTQEDIANKTSKGFYNATDLSRVEEWCAYLTSKLNQYSYPISIEEHENQHSILKNGSLRTSINNWSKGAYTIPTATGEYTTLRTSNSLISLYQNFDNIQGNTQETKQIIYACAKVRKRTSTGISVSLDALKNNQRAVSILLSSIDGNLDDGKWHTLSARTSTLSNDNSYTFRSIWISGSNIESGEIDVKDVYIYNLTDIWGRGNEPSKSECDATLTSLWNVIEFPTYNEMARIRNNIIAIMQGYASISQMHDISSLNAWNFNDANNWEKILHEIDTMILGMENNFIVSGVSRVGQPRIWQQRFRRKHKYYEFHTWDSLSEEYWNDFDENQTWIGVEFLNATNN